MTETLYLVRYGEMFLKSDSVLKYFTSKLKNDLEEKIKINGIQAKVITFRDRLYIKIKEDESKRIENILLNTFGVHSFSLAYKLETTDLGEIESFIKEQYKGYISLEDTFAIRASKSSKQSYSTMDMGKTLGNLFNGIVDLSNPKKEICVEVKEKETLVYTSTQKGLGGLPVGSSGKILMLISGGIDSPVASFLMNKRGCENIFLHFHSFPLVSRNSINKVKELVKLLTKYQNKIKLILLPFSEIQNHIKALTEPKYRIVLYRRSMLRLANEIALSENLKILASGEALGQVSSQTLDNMYTISEASTLPILRPLICFDKIEIIDLAKKIGTYETSIQPQEDTCTLFTPKHPTTQADLETIKKIEENIGILEKEKEALTKLEYCDIF